MSLEVQMADSIGPFRVQGRRSSRSDFANGLTKWGNSGVM